MKEKQLYKRIIRLTVIILAVFSAILMTVVTQFKHNYNYDTYRYINGWYYYDADGNRTEVTLPADIDMGDEDTLTLYNDTFDKSYDYYSVYTYGARYGLEIYVNDENVYTFDDGGLKKNDTILNGIACGGRLYALTEGDNQVKFIYHHENGQFEIDEIRIAERESILFETFMANAYRLAIDTIMIVLGLMGIVMSIVNAIRRKYSVKMTALSVYLLLGSTWCFVDSSFVLMLFMYSNSLYIINHFMFMTMTIPLIYYVASMENLKKKGFLYVMEILSYLNVAVQLFLYSFGVTELFDLLTITHILLFTLVTGTVIICTMEYRRTGDREILTNLTSVGMLGVVGVFAIVLYLNGKFDAYQTVFQTGILLMIIVLLVNMILQYQKSIEQNIELAAYKNLADKDEMTGLKNRRAFDYILNKIEKKEISFVNILLVYIDLNDLKKINDTLGHMTGDRAIKRIAICINKVFDEPEYAFRLGGDEFAVIVVNPQKHAEEYKEDFFECVEMENHEFIDDYEVSAAFGYSHIYNGYKKIYKPISLWTAEADSRMYENKKQSKLSRSDREDKE